MKYIVLKSYKYLMPKSCMRFTPGYRHQDDTLIKMSILLIFFNSFSCSLIYLFILDRIRLQKKGFELLLQQAEAKKAEIVSLKADIDELNKYLVNKKEPVRSQFEIETLKGEIRELVNEKLKLEMEISKSL